MEHGEEFIKTSKNPAIFCSYCKDEIYDGEGYVYVEETDKYYHYSNVKPLENCYFPEEEE